MFTISINRQYWTERKKCINSGLLVSIKMHFKQTTEIPYFIMDNPNIFSDFRSLLQ